MLIKSGTLVYIKDKALQPSERYGVVNSSCEGKVLVQKLLSEESEMMTLRQEQVTIIFNPPDIGGKNE